MKQTKARNKEIVKAKARYEILKKQKEDLASLREDLAKNLEQLEQEETVKRYLYLKKQVESQQPIPSDQELISTSFWNVDKEKLDKIYFYEGAYIRRSQEERDDFTPYIERADYVKYRNIANYEDVVIQKMETRRQFEKENKVVRTILTSKKLITAMYDQLSDYYFELLLTANFSEEEIIAKLKKKIKEL